MDGAGSTQSVHVLEARASQDSYGAGPQTFPYVSFFPETFYGTGSSDTSGTPPRKIYLANFGAQPSDEHGAVTISGGTVYCGTQSVSTGPLTISSNGDVFLNISMTTGGSFSAALSKSRGGDLSILCYTIYDRYIDDYLSGTVFIPYYN